jgi:hypothetical protein
MNPLAKGGACTRRGVQPRKPHPPFFHDMHIGLHTTAPVTIRVADLNSPTDKLR